MQSKKQSKPKPRNAIETQRKLCNAYCNSDAGSSIYFYIFLFLRFDFIFIAELPHNNFPIEMCTRKLLPLDK